MGVIEFYECIGFVLSRSGGDGFSRLPLSNEVLFSLFNVTCSVVQESFILSECHVLHNTMFWPQMLYFRGFPTYMNSKCHFVYTL